MKRFLAALLAALTVFTLTGCGKTENPAEPVTPGQGEEPAAPTEPELTPEEIAEQERLAAEKAREERLQGLLDSMTLEEKVGQLFFVRCPETNAVEDISTYHLGGYLLFGRDYKDGDSWLTWEQFIQKIESYQDAAAIPLLIGSDEEGGTVTRASRNPNLFSEPFKSPQKLNYIGGIEEILRDTDTRSRELRALGINVNFAPVCDVSTDPKDFIYDRTLGQDANMTADYVRLVVPAMTVGGTLPVLKHFPGYGSNADTHTGIAVDQRPMETFETSDLLPFKAGIEAGTPFVLVSHNIVNCMDPELPASLSPAVHKILREECGFDGIAITDDLAMDAVKAYAKDGAVACWPCKRETIWLLPRTTGPRSPPSSRRYRRARWRKASSTTPVSGYCGARTPFWGSPKTIPDWIFHENSLICYDFLRLCNQNVPFFVFPCEQLLERPVYGKGAFL